MEDLPQGLIFAGFILLAILGGAFSWWQAKKRREAFQALARKLGMRYIRRDRGIANRYSFLNKLAQGSNRYAFNILEGQFRGHPVHAFDYHYETYSTDSKGRRRTHHHYFSFFILHHQHYFPELRIYPETFLSKIGQMIGYGDIDFESIEFSKAFTVRSSDKKFAYDICHTRMMEYMLRDTSLALEFEGQCIALEFSSKLAVEQIEARLNQLCDIRDLIPDYVFAA
jgi:hypothetical protein